MNHRKVEDGFASLMRLSVVVKIKNPTLYRARIRPPIIGVYANIL